MFRDLEILASCCIVELVGSPWFVLFQVAIRAKFVYDFIGHDSSILAYGCVNF